MFHQIFLILRNVEGKISILILEVHDISIEVNNFKFNVCQGCFPLGRNLWRLHVVGREERLGWIRYDELCQNI